jgi:hypothetical protein
MTRIDTHAIDEELARRVHETRIPGLQSALSHARTDSSALNALISAALDGAALSMILGEGDAIARKYARIAGQASAAIFAVATATAEVKVPLGGALTALPPKASVSGAYVGNWLNGFHAAAVARDTAVLDRLSALDIQVLRRSPARSDECMFATVEAFNAFHRNDPGVAKRIIAALEATDPALVQHTPDEVGLIVVPMLGALGGLLSNQEVFDERMVTALELHKQYWSDEERRRDPLGYLSWPLMGIASLAIGRRMEVNVDSDYLPRALYIGD